MGQISRGYRLKISWQVSSFLEQPVFRPHQSHQTIHGSIAIPDLRPGAMEMDELSNREPRRKAGHRPAICVKGAGNHGGVLLNHRGRLGQESIPFPLFGTGMSYLRRCYFDPAYHTRTPHHTTLPASSAWKTSWCSHTTHIWLMFFGLVVSNMLFLWVSLNMMNMAAVLDTIFEAISIHVHPFPSISMFHWLKSSAFIVADCVKTLLNHHFYHFFPSSVPIFAG